MSNIIFPAGFIVDLPNLDMEMKLSFSVVTCTRFYRDSSEILDWNLRLKGKKWLEK